MITVMGATGNTGRKITTLLLDAGEEVRAVGRSASRLADLADAGAQPVAGDPADPAFLTGAFRGADAVYTLLPFDPAAPDMRAAYDALGTAIATAVHDARVRHVVALSAVGADLPAGTGFIALLHTQEQRLRALAGTNVLLLRPGSFFENLAAALEPIRVHGVHADSVAPDARIPMIATRDVAAAAAAALRARDWTGVAVRELLGPRDLSNAEIIHILGDRIGRPDLRYVQLPDADMVAALTSAGFSADVAGRQVEMNRAVTEGRVVSREGRTPANTTPTRFEDYAAELSSDHGVA